MSQLTIYQCLDALLPKLQDPRLLSNRGIGNEIGFYIFDYDPEYEPLVQQRVDKLISQLTSPPDELVVVEINLYKSILDAFQVASKEISNTSLGVLVPFHTFYMAVEGFLDSVISQVIVQGEENSQLQQPFDIELLKTLFMIKYVKEIRANVDNLTTLSISHIDQDRLALKQEVEKALERLERQTLIQRNGGVYEFLTYEEQDIGREIKNTQFENSKVVSELQKLVWEAIFTDKQLRYSQQNLYKFNRKLDEQTYGQQVSDLTLHVA